MKLSHYAQCHHCSHWFHREDLYQYGGHDFCSEHYEEIGRGLDELSQRATAQQQAINDEIERLARTKKVTKGTPHEL